MLIITFLFNIDALVHGIKESIPSKVIEETSSTTMTSTSTPVQSSQRRQPGENGTTVTNGTDSAAITSTPDSLQTQPIDEFLGHELNQYDELLKLKGGNDVRVFMSCSSVGLIPGALMSNVTATLAHRLEDMLIE